MRISYINKILGYLEQMEYRVLYKEEASGILKVTKEEDGIGHLIIGVVPPILIFESFLFNVQQDDLIIYKALLQKNRDMIHGAFVLNSEGTKVLYRYTLQIENVDFNEFESAINALSFLLSEYAEQIILFSKQ